MLCVASVAWLVGCATSARFAHIDPAIDEALAALTEDREHWAWLTGSVAVRRGVLRVDRAALAAITSGADAGSRDMHGNRTWNVPAWLDNPQSLPDGPADAGSFRFSLYFWEHSRERDYERLQTLVNRPVWIGIDADGGQIQQVTGIHDVSLTSRQLDAVCCLLRVPVALLARDVARASPAIDAVVAGLRMRRLAPQRALERFEPWQPTLLPALLHVIVQSLDVVPPGELLDDGAQAQIQEYHTRLWRASDVALFAAQDLRGLLSGVRSEPEARVAEARGLAVWLLLQAKATPLHASASFRDGG
ncbi:MAG: hypothetical protein WAT39_23355 [Planctomycetota bacterium]